MSPTGKRPRIVIIGGGFAGVKCARTLSRALGDSVELVLFSRDNHMVFQPLLPDVAGSSLNPRAVAPPLRQLLPRVLCRTEIVQRIDLAASTLVHEGHDGAPRSMAYDHLVIACGNVVNLNLLPGMASHALPLKTIGDAIAMRAHVMQQLDKADLAETEALRRYYLTFIVVGGGFSGVEVAGEINDLLHGVRRLYPNVRREDIRVALLHGMPEILPEVSAKLRRFAHERMVKNGVDVITSLAVTEVTSRGARLADGRKIEGATIICTVGTTSNPLVAALDVPKERGRLLAEPDMHLRDHANVWAIGDCALVKNARDGQFAPPTAQFGERMGRQCAQNIIRVLRGETTQPFDYQPVGVACGIGGHNAVAEIMGFKFSGFIAWWMWRSSFLLKIPTLTQKLKVGFDWAWELVFPRDLSHFRPAQSDPIGRAHFGAGETVFARHTPTKAMYAIETGDAEIMQRDADGTLRALATLGPGTLLGDATLAAFGDTDVFVRARTALDVHTLGKDALTRLSSALAPIEAIIERAVNRPRVSIWRHHPAAMRSLSQRTVGELPTSYAVISAQRADPLGPVFNRLIAEKNGCAVVLDGERLAGIATRTDLLDALARGATRDTPIGDAMNRRPIRMLASDSAALAAERMADDGLKFLPIVDADDRPVAVLTADDFVRYALMAPR
jgi:NADH:ubiquinone reductase (H+-translocating)